VEQVGVNSSVPQYVMTEFHGKTFCVDVIDIILLYVEYVVQNLKKKTVVFSFVHFRMKIA